MRATAMRKALGAAAVLGSAFVPGLSSSTVVMSGCVTAGLNGNERPDIACIAGGTTGVKWYENLGR